MHSECTTATCVCLNGNTVGLNPCHAKYGCLYGQPTAYTAKAEACVRSKDVGTQKLLCLVSKGAGKWFVCNLGVASLPQDID